MLVRRRQRRTANLFKFDLPFVQQHTRIAGVDEVGRGPLAGPVVAAAVILRIPCRLPNLNDSKKLSAGQRETLFPLIHGAALAVGIGIIEADEIDRINIHQAGFAAMRAALAALTVEPQHVLIDGFVLPKGPRSQTRVIGGDAKSAHIAAASIIAKVTRDRIMESLHIQFPVYGFKNHKGYCTREHLAALQRHGPCPIHRMSYAPVLSSRTNEAVLSGGSSKS